MATLRIVASEDSAPSTAPMETRVDEVDSAREMRSPSTVVSLWRAHRKVEAEEGERERGEAESGKER